VATQKSNFIAVDWGTSSFRAALLAPDGEILGELATQRGITTFKKGEFTPYLIATCADLAKNGAGFYLMSGMIGSRNGLLEVPYCPCPAGVSEIAGTVGWVVANKIAIVPGLRNGFDDVMRGEESQVLGAAAVLGLNDALMVLPGTHSKWVNWENGAITGFDTFMTGEFYALLKEHSILAKSMAEPDAWDASAFIQGLETAMQGESLLHTAFSVRVKSLFNQLETSAASSYLSGLVIGEELAAMQVEDGMELLVIGSQTLCERYSLALAHLGARAKTLGNQAAWAGLHAIYQRLKL
jgi:2-dehydro-3-deoxygalactonokinase